MCRSIKTLFNFDPPATRKEIREASLQFVRKISGFTVPSKANEVEFVHAIKEVDKISQKLLKSLVTKSPPRNRNIKALRATLRR